MKLDNHQLELLTSALNFTALIMEERRIADALPYTIDRMYYQTIQDIRKLSQLLEEK